MKVLFKSFLIAVAVLLVISGCRSPFETPQTSDIPAGKGLFSLVVTNSRAARTIMPDDINNLVPSDFALYKLEFFASGETTDPELYELSYDELADAIELDAGTWDLRVSAYYLAEETELAAQGWLTDIVITDGATVSGNVTIVPVNVTTGTGTGTFTWDIDWNKFNITSLVMTITPFDAETGTAEQTLVLVGETTTNDLSDSLTLNAGFYRVVLTADTYDTSNNTNNSVELRETLHVYTDKESIFTHVFTTTQFTNLTYTISFNSNGGTRVANQYVQRGNTAVMPPEPTRTGYSFLEWYSNSGLTTLFDFNTVVTSNRTLYAKWQQDGIYVGIITFAENATDLSTDLVLLDSSGRSSLVSMLNNQYIISSNPGTALFYGVHKALANLKAKENNYRVKLDSVNIVTFTDGLDNQSAGLSRNTQYTIEGQTFTSQVPYTEYVNTQINTRLIAGVPIIAYSVGVIGDDVTDKESFREDLAKIASEGNSFELDNFDEVQEIFDEIADSLTIAGDTIINFNMVTTLLNSGDRVRMTFDVTDLNPLTMAASAAASERYIEGTIDVDGNNEYTLTDITYSSGISSQEGAGPIAGEMIYGGLSVLFKFNGITGYNPDTDLQNTRQWTMTDRQTTWQHNGEFDTDGSSETSYEKRSSIIYLVLDRSTSLSTAQIAQIRSAAINFINSLYVRYNQ